MSVVPRVCPLTGRAGRTRVLPYAPSPWILLQCLDTGFVFLANPPVPASWAAERSPTAVDAPSAWPGHGGQAGVLPPDRMRMRRRGRLLATATHLLRASLARHPAPLRVLDVRCGRGDLLVQAIGAQRVEHRSRCVPYGIEASPTHAQAAASRFIAMAGVCAHDAPLTGLRRFPRDFFDLVVIPCWLQCELDPRALLRECALRLHPDGLLVVAVPHLGSLGRLLRGERWRGFRWPAYVNCFTPATLADMAGRVGLRVARMNLFDRHPFSSQLHAVLARSAGAMAG